MPHPRFDHLRERLLRAGIAPRHVSRYISELRDHFDDLVREETANGAGRGTAEAEALSRLGNDDDLAEVMLERPGLRSVTARYPWAVFGIGPVAMLIAAFAAVLLIEIGALNLISHFYKNPTHRLPPAWFTLTFDVWNGLPTYVAPLAIAALLYFMGTRQRISTIWIVLGVAVVCVLGGFQDLSFTENGYHGELLLVSGLLPPFPRNLIIAGVWHAIADLAFVAGAWWLMRRRPMSMTGSFVTTAS
jgi:hypothetical protein